MTTGLTLIVVGKDQEDLMRFKYTHLGHTKKMVLIANVDNLSLAAIGNSYLDIAETGIVGLCHADCVFEEGALDAFWDEAEKGTVCGIVGRENTEEYRQGYRWCNQNPGEVSTLDNCCVFLRVDLGLRFDAETFDGLHCHVADLCLQAQQKGILSVVPAAEAQHLGTLWIARRSGELWLADYQRYRERLVKKWAGVSFSTT